MHYITDDFYSIDKIDELIASGEKVGISESCKNKIQHCASYLKNKLASGNQIIYGINTGFGSLCDTVVSNEELEDLQVNLVRSHACGTGATIPNSIVKRMLLLKAIALSKGHSGVYLETVERILWLYFLIQDRYHQVNTPFQNRTLNLQKMHQITRVLLFAKLQNELQII